LRSETVSECHGHGPGQPSIGLIDVPTNVILISRTFGIALQLPTERVTVDISKNYFLTLIECAFDILC